MTSSTNVTALEELTLLPTQAHALAELERELGLQHGAVLAARNGTGRSTILRALHRRLGGAFLTSREFIEASVSRHPMALEETVYQVLKRALAENDVVIVDDFNLIANIMCCSHMYPRTGFVAAALVPLAMSAQNDGKKLVIATDDMALPGLFERFPHIRMRRLTEEDYAAICESGLGRGAQHLDTRKIYRFAGKLNARQLGQTCVALRSEADLDTDRFMQYLREHQLISNVDLGEVQAVNLSDLKGLDDILEALEANVILPLENAELAEELKLKPKRGVLLAGPPGTGKTTIGRALAHRLQSKFFLIDGTVISGTGEFYHHIHRVFEAAQQNAPSIIFIDDSDVIFESGQETGLYRYLLTMLDGLESASASRVCLMMTAMDVGNLPPALVRSGRIELWLETTLPLQEARAAILRDCYAELPADFGDVDIDELAAQTEGLSGADLKRVVEDGKLLFAYERTRNARMLPATQYFLRAIETVRRNKQQYAEAEARARTRQQIRPPYFDVVDGAGYMQQFVSAEIIPRISED